MTEAGRAEGTQRFRLDGRVALVTGANGILGSRYVQALAEQGAHVVVADLDQDASARVADQLSRTSGVACMGAGLDVSDPASVEGGVDAVVRRFGRIDILLNNAATKGDDLKALFTPTVEYDLAVWRQIMSVNIDGQFLMARAVGRHMLEAGCGSIVNVSSIYGMVGPDQRIYEGAEYLGVAINTPIVYSVSKAATHGLTRHLATEWGARGVRVNTLTPGGVESGQNDVFMRRYAARTPLGRMARDDEMVGAVLFLASDASSYVTGQNIVVDGGWTTW
ncbi:SDR family oxidoreductase [uncultured Brevundimonas sp.]|uniref:SDR family oxidoreductase n=1 Tax=uncultured Brevundimonas sp. TaxID=213418 RepID=UPI00262F6EFF|nr:SDR family oxidoreductase [uncultured Brevundimonas sp.]